MFLLNELILSSPLAIYTYIRVLRLFSRNASRVLFTAGFVVLLAGFPIAETLSHRGAGGLAKIVMIAGYDALPLLLYLILTVIVSDLAIAVARLLKVISREAVRRPRETAEPELPSVAGRPRADQASHKGTEDGRGISPLTLSPYYM